VAKKQFCRGRKVRVAWFLYGFCVVLANHREADGWDLICKITVSIVWDTVPIIGRIINSQDREDMSSYDNLG
jgi:hypothetical protein